MMKLSGLSQDQPSLFHFRQRPLTRFIMSENHTSAAYTPAIISVPPIYQWPLKPFQALKWLFYDLMFPWGVFWLALSVISWQFLTPELSRMATLEFGWMAQIWLRNAALLTLVAGGLHWWFYIRQSQNMETKFTRRWLATGDDSFLWGDQVKDNMFWSLASGVTIWTLYEGLTLWWYANGYVTAPSFTEAPVYFALMIWLVFFWSTFHFYLNHRALHWKPLYEISHELHHRNANTGPWTGISMHPIEHLIYFSVFLLWWMVPVHPVIIILCGIFQGVSPSVSHSGFDYMKVSKSFKIKTGDNFHNLHHRFFHINYGNITTPIDRVFNSWHDGSEAGRAMLKQRMKKFKT